MPVYMDDKRLAKQLLAGDAHAFDKFFDENFARLYRFAMARISDDPEGAREVVQTVLTRAVQKMHTYRAESAMFTWLCAICRNEISDWLSRQGRYRDHIVLVEDFPEVQAAVDSFQAPVADSPERHYQRVEALRLIQVALDRLPPKYGDVLEWKYVEGHSVREIAARLDIGTEATQSLIARAKRAFADVYSTMIDALNTHDGLMES
ncbi:MAG: RNA polymerase sigma factor [Woeseiaceae bacterium]|jgi:RNA polymerase sigma-70 factor (ECF subfamily)